MALGKIKCLKSYSLTADTNSPIGFENICQVARQQQQHDRLTFVSPAAPHRQRLDRQVQVVKEGLDHVFFCEEYHVMTARR